MDILIICLTIFFARAIDVCLGTFRTVLIVKDKKLASTIIAFIEVLIWFFIAREAITSEITSLWIPLSFAGGFASGTYIGLLMSNRFISGQYTINAVSSKIKEKDIEFIKNKGYGISYLMMEGKKKFLIIQIDKKQIDDIKKILKSLDKEVFIIANETKYAHNAYIKNL